MDIKTSIRSRIFWAVSSALIMISAGDISAAEFSGELRTDYEYSSNVEEVTTNTSEDVSQTIGVNLEVVEEGKSLRADANISIEYRSYFNDNYDDETSFTSGFGLFRLDLIESFLDWRANFTRSEVLRDSADNNNEVNREYRSIFRSGPVVSYSITNSSVLDLATRYIFVENSDDSASDSERLEGELDYTFGFNSVTELSLKGVYEDLIDSDEEEKFHDYTVSAGFTRRFSNGEASVNYGRTIFNPDAGREVEGDFYDLSLRKDKVYLHNLSVQYYQEISDTSIGFESDEEGNGIDIDPNRGASVSDIVNRKRLTLRADRLAERYRYDLTGVIESEFYNIQSYTERYRSIRAGLDSMTFSRFVPRIEYTYIYQNFGARDAIGVDRTRIYTITGSYQSALNLELSSAVGYTKRSNSKNRGREYENLSFSLGVSWEFL